MYRFLIVLALCCAGPAFAQTVPVATLAPAVWRFHAQVSARLAAQQQAVLASARGGIITAVLYGSGQAVRAGQVLVQLDDGPERAQLALDEVRLAQAGKDAARTERLMSINGASQAALEQAQAAVAEAHAQVGLDQVNLAQLRIVAPFDGVMGVRNIDPGDYLQPGQAAGSLTGAGPLRVLFSLPQTEASGVAPGDVFSLSAANGETPIQATGTVVAVSPAQDVATDSRAVEGRVAAAFLPGMIATVDIATGAPVPAFAVPSTALNDSTMGPFLFAINAGKSDTLSTVYVSIYGSQGGETLVSTAGLRAGEQVVALGGFKLTDGASITPESP